MHIPLVTTANPRWMRLDDRLYLRAPDPSGVGDTLFDTSDAPEPVAGIRLPSATTNVVRFR